MPTSAARSASPGYRHAWRANPAPEDAFRLAPIGGDAMSGARSAPASRNPPEPSRTARPLSSPSGSSLPRPEPAFGAVSALEEPRSSSRTERQLSCSPGTSLPHPEPAFGAVRILEGLAVVVAHRVTLSSALRSTPPCPEPTCGTWRLRHGEPSSSAPSRSARHGTTPPADPLIGTDAVVPAVPRVRGGRCRSCQRPRASATRSTMGVSPTALAYLLNPQLGLERPSAKAVHRLAPHRQQGSARQSFG